MPDAVNQLLATEAALDKLGARGISVTEAEQTIWNLHVIVRNRRGSPERLQPATRRLVVGWSDANRVLTLVIEETVEYPIGHRRRRAEGLPLLVDKFRTNLRRRYSEQQQEKILDASLDREHLEQMPVHEYVDLYVL